MGEEHMSVDPVDELVDQWFDERFRGSLVAQAGSDVWNVAFEAKEDLKRRLRELKTAA